MWAEPKVDHAVELLEGVMADPARARAIAARGRRDIRVQVIVAKPVRGKNRTKPRRQAAAAM